MRSVILISAAALTVASCDQPNSAGDQAAFARELAGHVAGAPQTCVSAFPNQNLRVIDSRTLAYGYGRTIYVNKLPGDCPALSPFNTVIAELHGNEYCRGDRIRGREPGAIIPGPYCTLGNWTPYTMR